MATVNAIALSLITEAEESTDDAGFVTKIEKRVNEALQEIGLAANFNPFRARSSFSTAAATPTYNLPAKASQIIQLHFTVDGVPIPMRSVQELSRLGLRLEETGRPQCWIEDGVVQSGANNLVRIRMVPVPVSIESVEEEHYFDPTDTASASNLEVPDSFLVAVRLRTQVAMLINDGKYTAAALIQRQYDQNLKRLVEREHEKPSQKIVLKEVDIVNVRRRRGPRLPGNYDDRW